MSNPQFAKYQQANQDFYDSSIVELYGAKRDALHLLGRIREGATELTKAAKHMQQTERTDEAIALLLQLASDFTKLKDADSLDNVSKQIIQIWRKKPDKKSWSIEQVAQLAIDYQDCNKPDGAIELEKLALKNANSLKKRAMALQDLAGIYIKQDDYTSAETYSKMLFACLSKILENEKETLNQPGVMLYAEGADGYLLILRKLHRQEEALPFLDKTIAEIQNKAPDCVMLLLMKLVRSRYLVTWTSQTEAALKSTDGILLDLRRAGIKNNFEKLDSATQANYYAEVMLARSTALRLLGKEAEACSCLQEGLAMLDRNNDAEWVHDRRLGYLHRLVECSLKQGKRQQAEFYVQQEMKELRSCQAEIILPVVDQTASLFRELKDHKTCEVILLARLKHSNDSTQRLITLNNLCANSYEAGDNTKALKYAHEVMDILDEYLKANDESLDNFVSSAFYECLTRMSEITRRSGKEQEAERLLDAQISKVDSRCKNKVINFCMYKCGSRSGYQFKGNVEKALKYAKMEIALAENKQFQFAKTKDEITNLLTDAYLDEQEVYANTNRYREAIEPARRAFEESKNVSLKIRNDKRQETTLWLAKDLAEAGQMREAILYFDILEKEWDELANNKNRPYRVLKIVEAAEILEKHGEYERAHRLSKKSDSALRAYFGTAQYPDQDRVERILKSSGEKLKKGS